MKPLCAAVALIAATPLWAQEADELRYVTALLDRIQPRSIAQNREYCGYIGFDAQGALASTRPVRGTAIECQPEPEDGLELFASWHTHGAFDEDAWSEVPSVNDIEADEDEGVDGYVSTPSGRVWFVDTEDMVVSQVCGPDCVFADRRHRMGVDGKIAQSYSYEELLAREAAQ